MSKGNSISIFALVSVSAIALLSACAQDTSGNSVVKRGYYRVQEGQIVSEVAPGQGQMPAVPVAAAVVTEQTVAAVAPVKAPVAVQAVAVAAPKVAVAPQPVVAPKVVAPKVVVAPKAPVAPQAVTVTGAATTAKVQPAPATGKPAAKVGAVEGFFAGFGRPANTPATAAAPKPATAKPAMTPPRGEAIGEEIADREIQNLLNLAN